MIVAFDFIPRPTIVAGYYDFTLVVHVSFKMIYFEHSYTAKFC